MKKNNKKINNKKKYRLSPLLSISILIVITALAADIWLIYYHKFLPQAEISGQAAAKKIPEKIYNISGIINKLNDDSLILSNNNGESIAIKLTPGTKYTQLKLSLVGNQPKLQQTIISKNRLHENQKAIVYTQENVREEKTLTANRVELLP